MFSICRNPDLDDRIFDCFNLSIAAVQAEDVRASFMFVANLNGHHREWLGSTTTNRHGVAAFDFITVSGCDQLVVGPTHARGGILDLLMTDVTDVVRVPVAAPIFNLCVSRKVFHKHQVNWNAVCGAMQDLPWRTIWSADNPVEVLN